MSGIVNKIGETLHVGGNKKEEENKGQSHGEQGVIHGYGEHKPDHHGEENKEGFVDKIKDKVHGDNKGGEVHGYGGEHKGGSYGTTDYKDEHHGEHKGGEVHGYGEHKGDNYFGNEYKGEQHGEQNKEGIVDKIKDKIHGGDDKGEGAKKKKDKKEHGHEHGHDGSSSDSD